VRQEKIGFLYFLHAVKKSVLHSTTSSHYQLLLALLTTFLLKDGKAESAIRLRKDRRCRCCLTWGLIISICSKNPKDRHTSEGQLTSSTATHIHK
jgi:hypothetical protein